MVITLERQRGRQSAAGKRGERLGSVRRRETEAASSGRKPLCAHISLSFSLHHIPPKPAYIFLYSSPPSFTSFSPSRLTYAHARYSLRRDLQVHKALLLPLVFRLRPRFFRQFLCSLETSTALPLYSPPPRRFLRFIVVAADSR